MGVNAFDHEGVTYLSPEMWARFQREEEAQARAYEAFREREERRQKWHRVRTVAWVCVAVPLAPLVVLYAAGRLAWEWRR